MNEDIRLEIQDKVFRLRLPDCIEAFNYILIQEIKQASIEYVNVTNKDFPCINILTKKAERLIALISLANESKQEKNRDKEFYYFLCSKIKFLN